MSPPELNNPLSIAVTPEITETLRRLFVRHRRVTLIKEFSNGLSGSRVFAVRPLSSEGRPELPAVVKIASTSMIKQELKAIRRLIDNRLPKATTNASRSIIVAEHNLGALRYPMLGSGNDEILSLHDYFHQPDTSADSLRQLIERLLLVMDHIWRYGRVKERYSFANGYDVVLPPNLLVAVAAEPLPTTLLTPKRACKLKLLPGDGVTVRDFVVRKVDLSRRTVTLGGAPQHAFGLRLKFPDGMPMPHYRLYERIAAVSGIVEETRHSRLRDELLRLFPQLDPLAPTVALAEGIGLPNPLAQLDQILQGGGSVHLATIHGDLNLQNILVDIDAQSQFGDVNLIDFAEAREEHVLHDLLRLETEIITHLLPIAIQKAGVDPITTLADLSWRCHRMLRPAALEPDVLEHSELDKIWALLRAIRRAARTYLHDPNDPDEYYRGLTLYLLGALRFRNLNAHAAHPLPKRLAFWSALLAFAWLRHPDIDTTPPTISALLRARRSATRYARVRWAPTGHAALPRAKIA
ncbi:hypothetical protein HC891_01375 [Candidatus Gracilibacteria bacterium]|nr:hypothetical protein [Candidatus Gracilibacteria bacterium]